MKGIKKLYYSIREVSEMTGQETHALRYWESEFSQLSPKRNRAGNRVYTEQDVAMVKRIRHLLKEEKYTLEGARQVLDEAESSAEQLSQDQETLLQLRDFLQQLKQKL